MLGRLKRALDHVEEAASAALEMVDFSPTALMDDDDHSAQVARICRQLSLAEALLRLEVERIEDRRAVTS